MALVNSGNQQEGEAKEVSRLVLQADRSLLERLKLERIGKPLAIGAVVNELCSTKALMSLPEFMSARISIYDSGWLPYRIASFVVGRPLWWALGQIGVIGDENVSSSSQRDDWYGEYVLMELLEKAADTVMALQEAKMTGPADALYTLEDFRKSFASIFDPVKQTLLSGTDTKIIIKFLERERKTLVVDNGLVKFVDRNGPSDERMITTVDHGILELKSAISSLRNVVEAIQTKIDGNTKKATSALKQKQKSLALSYLRSRKQLGEVLQKRLASLATLESTMITIETATGDVQIMKSYEASASTLRSILSHPSLQRTNIEKTMDALAEANHAAQEVDDAIRIGGDVALGTNFDEDEIEDEWKALVQDIEANAETTLTPELPQVPLIPPRRIHSDESERVPLPTR